MTVLGYYSHIIGNRTALVPSKEQTTQSPDPKPYPHHKRVVGELVPVEEVLEEVGALVAGVPPRHG